MCRWIQQSIARLARFIPMFRYTHDNLMDRQNRRHRDELIETLSRQRESDRKAVEGILEEMTKTAYSEVPQSPGRYILRVEFDPGITTWQPYMLEYIAEGVARRIRHEIVTTKFVQDASRRSVVPQFMDGLH